MAKISVSKLKKSLLTKSQTEGAIPPGNFVSTGLTTLNLAFTGRRNRGLAKGLYALFVGDSSTGKTWIAMQCLAEVCNNSEFDNYQIVADMPEGGALMNIERHFGKKLALRIRPPMLTEDGDFYDQNCHSSTVEEFYDNLGETMDKGPCIYLLDSMDALTTTGEQETDKKQRTARKGGKEASGSFGTDKARENSRKLRVACNRLKETGSILIIISQTRQRIGFLAQYDPKTRSGGDALRFFARLEIWLSVKEKYWEKIGNKKIKLGQKTKAKVVKNHVCGWEGEIDIPISKGVGVDDVGACIDFLVDFGHWTEKAKKITAPEFDTTRKREDLAAYIEVTDQEVKLRKLVEQVWREVEAKTSTKRKKRYA